MNICDMLFSTSSDEIRKLIGEQIAKGKTEDEAIDCIVDKIVTQTKTESEQGVVHGEVFLL